MERLPGQKILALSCREMVVVEMVVVEMVVVEMVVVEMVVVERWPLVNVRLYKIKWNLFRGGM